MRIDSVPNPLPGEVWRVDFNPTKGSETGKDRPAVVVSCAQFESLPVRIVVPVTGWDDKHLRYVWRIPLEPSDTNGLSKRSAADCGQVRVVSMGRFSIQVGKLSAEDLAEVRAGLAIAMDIDTRI